MLIVNYINNTTAAIDCGTLEDPENGNIAISTTTYNSVANYSCNTGYTLRGDMSQTCLDTGIWSGSEPNCTGMLVIKLHVQTKINSKLAYLMSDNYGDGKSTETKNWDDRRSELLYPFLYSTLYSIIISYR